MNWLAKLLGKKKTPELSAEEKEKSKRKWDGFDFFQKGRECYLNRQTEEALMNLDKAFENGFAENFPTEATNLYDMRAGCLQELGYDYDAINDFDKSIALSPNDCNKYFSRSISKGAILDLEGAVADLEKAIELSKIDNELNREYNDEAQKQGYKNGAAGMFVMRLAMAKMDLDSEIKDRESIENATTPKEKEFWQNTYDERREKRLSRTKKR
jgi:tetratricopeptide (TPR) repeat protein